VESLEALTHQEELLQPIMQHVFRDLKEHGKDLVRESMHLTKVPEVQTLRAEIKRLTQTLLVQIAKEQSTIGSTTSTTITTPIESRLRLDIPKFSGEPTDWMNFKALFTSVMVLASPIRRNVPTYYPALPHLEPNRRSSSLLP